MVAALVRANFAGGVRRLFVRGALGHLARGDHERQHALLDDHALFALAAVHGPAELVDAVAELGDLPMGRVELAAHHLDQLPGFLQGGDRLGRLLPLPNHPNHASLHTPVKR